MSSELDPRKARYQPSGHVCSVHDNRRHQVSVGGAFLKEGIALGQRCLLVGCEADFERFSAKLSNSGLNVARERSRGALQSVSGPDPLLESGRLAPQRLARFLARSEAAAIDDGFSGLRILILIDWVVSLAGEDGDPEGVEAVLDWCPPTSRSLILCQYYRPNLSLRQLVSALTAHPTIVVDREPVPNPYYEPLDLFPRTNSGPLSQLEAKRFEWRLKRLKEAGRGRVPRAKREEGPADLYRRLLETIPHTVWMTLPDGSTDFINRKGMEYFGFRQNSAYGWGWLDLLHPDFVERSRKLWETSVLTGQPYRNEYRLRTTDGTYRWILSQGVPVRNEDGTVQRWVGTWTDIEDFKRAEESSARGALLLANVRDAVVVTDLDGVVTYWNEGATKLFGWTSDEAVGRPLAERFPESFRPTVEEMTREFANGLEWSREWLDYRKDGSRVWINLRVTRIFDGEGRPFGIMSVSHDIDARKRAEAELLLRDRAIQAVTQGILITDPSQPNNPIIYASPGFERLTQYTLEEVLGRDCRFLWGQEPDPATVSRLAQIAREGRAETIELISYRKDGLPFWDQISVSPVTGESGELTHLVYLHNDVTQRRRLEDQYRQAQKMEAIGLLGGGVAHDFNNLLTIITGYTELLLHSLPAEDPKRKMLEEIQRAGERSVALTRQLLAFSRKQMLAPRVLDLNDVVRNTERMLRRVIGEDIELVTDLQSDLPSVRGDPGQLEQVLLNLSVNARDAMPQGGRLLLETRSVVLDEAYATVYTSLQPGPHVMLAVTDSGTGMTEEVKSRLFEPFFTTKPQGRGTGLGAAVVHGIIQQSGGHLEVESEPGRGTVFKIYLPAVQSADSQADSATRSSAVGGGETILLVEDDDGVRALSLQILRGGGYQVLEASHGGAALEIEEAHEGKIDLLITDVVMPGMGGRELSERLLERRPDLKVLFLSGYTDDSVVRHGVFQDKVNFLQKPFAPGVLGRKVRQVLSE